MKKALEIIKREIAQREIANRHDHLGKEICKQELQELNKVVDLLVIYEAGNVTNETDYTPKQLAEQKAELIERLEYVISWLEDSKVHADIVRHCKETIKKATQ